MLANGFLHTLYTRYTFPPYLRCGFDGLGPERQCSPRSWGKGYSRKCFSAGAGVPGRFRQKNTEERKDTVKKYPLAVASYYLSLIHI